VWILGKPRNRRQAAGLVAAAAMCLTLFVTAKPLYAYIDPGTGGAIFSWLVPLLGFIGVVFLATLRYSWTFIRVVASAFWRHRRWTVPAISVGLAAVIWIAVAQKGKSEKPLPRVSVSHAVEPAAPEPSDAPSKAAPPGPRRRQEPGVARMQAVRRFINEHQNELRPAEGFHLFADDECPGIRRSKYKLGHETRNSFVIDRTTSIRKTLVPADQVRLLFHVGVAFPEGASKRSSFEFKLRATDSEGRESTLMAREWENYHPQDGWQRASIDLRQYTGRELTLSFDVVARRNGPAGGPAGLCLISDPRLADSGRSSTPNVILFSVETLRRDHLSLHGYSRRTSPFLEELAAESIVFEDAYSQSSWTRPSVATMLTGLYPSQHDAKIIFDRLRDSCVLLPEILRGHGYLTAGFCTNDCIAQPAFNYDQGYDLFVDEGYHIADKVTRDILAWLEGVEEDKPFFVFAHLWDPHGPYTAPGHYAEIFDPDYEGPLKDLAPLLPRKLSQLADLTPRDVDYVRARYDGEILYTDAVIRRFVEGLKERGLWDKTLFVLTSDHGEEFREHGGWDHGHNLFPEKLRVPLVMKLPDAKHGGKRIRGLAGGVDIVPTVLSVLDIPVPQGLLGVDLLAGLETSGKTGREFHFAEFWPCAHKVAGPPYYSVVSKRFQYILRQKGDSIEESEEFLFDLTEDPAAQNNLATSRFEVLEEYGAMIRRRYEKGYTLVANGGEGPPVKFTGRVRAEVPIDRLAAVDTEQDDVFAIESGKTALRFELTVQGDRDVLRFQTVPANSPVTITIECDGKEIPPDMVFLGARKERSEALPVEVPFDRCAVDTDPGVLLDYAPGREPGVYIWRNGTPRARTGRSAGAKEETLQNLKDLGYL